jgi:hypothetical protein
VEMVGQRERKTRGREAAYYDCLGSDAAWLLVLDEWMDDGDDDGAVVDEEDGVAEAETKLVAANDGDGSLDSERGFLDADGCGIGEPSLGSSDRVLGLRTGDSGYRTLVFAKPEAAPRALLPALASWRPRVGCIKMRAPTGLEVRRDESGLNEARNRTPEDLAGAFFA